MWHFGGKGPHQAGGVFSRNSIFALALPKAPSSSVPHCEDGRPCTKYLSPCLLHNPPPASSAFHPEIYNFGAYSSTSSPAIRHPPFLPSSRKEEVAGLLGDTSHPQFSLLLIRAAIHHFAAFVRDCSRRYTLQEIVRVPSCATYPFHQRQPEQSPGQRVPLSTHPGAGTELSNFLLFSSCGQCWSIKTKGKKKTNIRS